jgi:hypothetical protein
LVSTNPYTAGNLGSWAAATVFPVPVVELHAVPPAVTPDGSLAGWVVLAVLLAVVVAGGLVIASRR